MTSKEALEDLMKRNEHFKKNGVHIGIKTMDKIRELVERDTPKKVIYEKLHIAKCPNCNNGVSVFDLFCQDCGQRLDWSE